MKPTRRPTARRAAPDGTVLAAALAMCLAIALTAGLVAAPPVSAALPMPRNAEGLPTLAPILKDVTPAVVNISVTARTPQNQNPLLRDPFFRHFFNIPRGRPERSQAAGSGVIIDAEQGLVVTNHHVIEEAAAVTVTLKDGRRFEARLVGSDPGTDIALLRIEARGLSALEVGDSDALEVGDFVLAIGNPFGLGQTVTSGIVSALGRSGLNIEGYEDFIQTDASINPGNSGGALVDLRGRLVGINTAIIGPGGGNVGIGFAVPASIMTSVVDQLASHGRVRRGRLGVQIQELTPELARALDLEGRRGVVLTRIQRGSSADRAGLQPGDVVVAVDGRAVDDLADLRNRVGLTPVGDAVRLTVVRDGRERDITVRVGGPDGAASAAGREQGQPRTQDEGVTALEVPKLAGAQLRDLRPTDPQHGRAEGVLVDQVDPSSPAWVQGLRPGDLVVGLNQVRVRNLQQLAEVLRGAEQLLAFNVLRGRDRVFIIVH